MKKRLLAICLALLLLAALCACKDDTVEPTPTPTATPTGTPSPTAPSVEVVPTPTPDPTATPEPTPTATPAPANPLTGEPIEEEQANRRPVAVMLNNLKAALPQQGQSQADIIYEVLTEGGITRMLGIYQDVDGVDKIGSIRSARTYYLELALGHDAVFIHAGGSEDSYEKMALWGVTHLDGVRGPYMSNEAEGNLMWRDPVRRETMGLEHTVVTTGKKIQELLPTYGIRLDHKESFSTALTFTEDGTPASGQRADIIRVPYSSYKTGVFTYSKDTGLYMVEEYGNAYVDGNTGEQVGVTNVLVLRAACKNTGDSLGHITVDLSGGTGYYACGGKVISITWSKTAPDGELQYTDTNGNPLVLGVGRTYVNIVPTESNVTFN